MVTVSRLPDGFKPKNRGGRGSPSSFGISTPFPPRGDGRSHVPQRRPAGQQHHLRQNVTGGGHSHLPPIALLRNSPPAAPVARLLQAAQNSVSRRYVELSFSASTACWTGRRLLTRSDLLKQSSQKPSPPLPKGPITRMHRECRVRKR